MSVRRKPVKLALPSDARLPTDAKLLADQADVLAMTQSERSGVNRHE